MKENTLQFTQAIQKTASFFENNEEAFQKLIAITSEYLFLSLCIKDSVQYLDLIKKQFEKSVEKILQDFEIFTKKQIIIGAEKDIRLFADKIIHFDKALIEEKIFYYLLQEADLSLKKVVPLDQKVASIRHKQPPITPEENYTYLFFNTLLPQLSAQSWHALEKADTLSSQNKKSIFKDTVQERTDFYKTYFEEKYGQSNLNHVKKIIALHKFCLDQHDPASFTGMLGFLMVFLLLEAALYMIYDAFTLLGGSFSSQAVFLYGLVGSFACALLAFKINHDRSASYHARKNSFYTQKGQKAWEAFLGYQIKEKLTVISNRLISSLPPKENKPKKQKYFPADDPYDFSTSSIISTVTQKNPKKIKNKQVSKNKEPLTKTPTSFFTKKDDTGLPRIEWKLDNNPKQTEESFIFYLSLKLHYHVIPLRRNRNDDSFDALHFIFWLNEEIEKMAGNNVVYKKLCLTGFKGKIASFEGDDGYKSAKKETENNESFKLKVYGTKGERLFFKPFSKTFFFHHPDKPPQEKTLHGPSRLQHKHS